MSFGLGRLGAGFGRMGVIAPPVPGWVPRGYGFEQGIFAQPKLNRIWIAGQGVRTFDSAVTNTRASTEYVQDSTGLWTSVNSTVNARSDLGLQAYEARTNSIRNNSMQGAVAGTPGTPPTNWQVPSPSNGLSRQIVGTGTQNGIDYVDIRYSGTASGTSLTNVDFEVASQIAAAPSQNWTNSGFFSLVGGSAANVSFELRIGAYNSGVTLISNYAAQAFIPDASFTRISVGSAVLTPALTATVLPRMFFIYNSGAVIDFTIRIGWPQLELGASVTPPIRTTNTAVTRAADVPVMAIPAAILAKMAAGYTLYAKGTPSAPTTYGTTQYIAQITDGTSNNRLGLSRNSANANFNGTLVSGGSATTLSGTPISQSISTKMAMAIATADQAASRDGATVITASAAALPVAPTSLAIGNNGSGPSQWWNGLVEEFGLAPSRLTNAQLQALTT